MLLCLRLPVFACVPAVVGDGGRVVSTPSTRGVDIAVYMHARNLFSVPEARRMLPRFLRNEDRREAGRVEETGGPVRPRLCCHFISLESRRSRGCMNVCRG